VGRKSRALLRLLVVGMLLAAAACGGDDDGGGGGDEASGGGGDGGCPELPAVAEEGGAAEGSSTTAAADDAAGGAGGDEAGGGGGSGSEELFPVTVGILPIADLAPLHYGIEQGFFEEEGLDVQTSVGQGGAALLPSVLSGEYQFAFGNYVSVMLAAQEGADVQIVSNVVSGADTPDRGTNALLVSPDSGIESPDDLAGRTFAVTTLENVAEVNISTTLCRAGADISGIEFTEVPFPDMNAAVESGDVDVAWQAEPFVTLGEQAGLVSVADPMYETMPSMPLAGMFASGSWLEEHADHAAAFYRALQRSLEASSDEQAMRDAIAANTETPPDVVAELALANWQAELDEEKLGAVGQLAADFGILEEAPNLDDIVWTPPDE
jgi:NitT/TauT family transport system substrate-binding protein